MLSFVSRRVSSLARIGSMSVKNPGLYDDRRYLSSSSASDPPASPPPPPPPTPPSKEEVDRIFNLKWKPFFATIKNPGRFITKLEVVIKLEKSIKKDVDRNQLEYELRRRKIGVSSSQGADQYVFSSGLDVITNKPLGGYTLSVDAAKKDHVIWAHTAVIRKDGVVLNFSAGSIPEEFLQKPPYKTYANDAEVVATSLGLKYFVRKVANRNCSDVRVITDNKTAEDVFNGAKYKNENPDYEVKINDLIKETQNIMAKAGIKFNVTWEKDSQMVSLTVYAN